jgi:hypothetical protein
MHAADRWSGTRLKLPVSGGHVAIEAQQSLVWKASWPLVLWQVIACSLHIPCACPLPHTPRLQACSPDHGALECFGFPAGLLTTCAVQGRIDAVALDDGEVKYLLIVCRRQRAKKLRVAITRLSRSRYLPESFRWRCHSHWVNPLMTSYTPGSQTALASMCMFENYMQACLAI